MVNNVLYLGNYNEPEDQLIRFASKLQEVRGYTITQIYNDDVPYEAILLSGVNLRVENKSEMSLLCDECGAIWIELETRGDCDNTDILINTYKLLKEVE